MSEMYKYLQEHNYISRNKNKIPFQQQELSKERAEAIANKCDNLLQQKDNIIKEVREYIKENMKDSQLIFGINDINRLYVKNMNDILEILDKVQNEENK